MGYKKIKPVLTNIDNLANECGLFCDTDLNGGYGCRSKSKQKEEPGCCYDWDCPLANVADLSNLKIHDDDLYKEYWGNFKNELNSGVNERDCEIYDWLIQYQSI